MGGRNWAADGRDGHDVRSFALQRLFGHIRFDHGLLHDALHVFRCRWDSSGLAGIGIARIAIPLPFNLDQSLVVEMQFWASQLAAQLLDGLGVMHFRQGVILVTEKSQFMTEEACSGIRSLFSSLAFVSVLSVMQRHHVLRLIFNLLQTVAWVILGNALRVAAVVMLTDHVSDWFATGAGHEALGMAVFGFILLMVVSTDAFVGMLLFRPLVVDHEAWEQPIGPAPPAPLSASDVEPDPWKPGDAIWGPQSKSLKLAWAGLFLFIGLLGSWVAVVHTGVLEQGLGVIAMPDMPPPAEDDLPVMLGNGWQRTKFEHVKRDINPLLAEESYVYHYARNGRGFVISVDLPWSEWHNLNLCYSNLGWESKPNYFVARPQSGAGASQTELDLSRMDKWAFVIFAVMDRKQRELSPDWRTALQGWRGVLTGVLQQSAASVGLGRDKQIALSGQALPATTIQLLTESGEPFTEQDREEFRVLYDEVRKATPSGPTLAWPIVSLCGRRCFFQAVIALAVDARFWLFQAGVFSVVCGPAQRAGNIATIYTAATSDKCDICPWRVESQLAHSRSLSVMAFAFVFRCDG